MEKLKMQSENLVNENIGKIAELFPNCVTEGYDSNDKLIKMVDFDLLKQELSDIVVEGNVERYTMTWPGKKQAILTANSPINATLRPCKEESVDFDNTQNLYIEGDNLDVLKLLRETYLNKIKMIYIDPPYNTGNDFVYEDDFASSAEEYLQASKSYDEQGNKLFQNNDSNGRFHSDWLSMMYSRLKLAKDLLTDDGVIFISIDDNEQENLKKICNEIFGELNWKATFCWRKTHTQTNIGDFARVKEYILCYAKNIKNCIFNKIALTNLEEYRYQDENGEKFRRVNLIDSTRGRYEFEIINPKGNIVKGKWMKPKEEIVKMIEKNDVYWAGETPYGKNYLKLMKEKGQIANDFLGIEYGTNQRSTMHLDKLMGNLRVFDFSKPLELLKFFINLSLNKNSIILDFFSGSSTTAHAVMQLNAEDGGNRKYICIQLPEKCDEKSEAFKAGYKNICEIGKERIRRAGKKIKEELLEDGCGIREHVKGMNEKKIQTAIGEKTIQWKVYDLPSDYQQQNEKMANDLDTGFRVLKLDSSCMKDTYYNPEDITQDLLAGLEDNIKEDRTPEDLLFQVMLDMGVLLSSKIEEKIINNKKVFIVGEYDNYSQPNLVCCFDNNLSDDVVKEIAKMKPLYAVFRDSSIAIDSVSVNFDQIFETYSPTTKRRVL